MLKATIRINEGADVEAEAMRLSERCARAALCPGESDAVIQEFVRVASSLVDKGQSLRSVGGHMNAQHEIKGEGHSVHVVFRTGQPAGMLRKALDSVADRCKAAFGGV